MKPCFAVFAIILAYSQLPGQPHIGTCAVFPDNNIWNTRTSALPVLPRSSQYVATIGADLTLRSDFGSGLWNGAPIGIPYVIVSEDIPKQPIVFVYTDESDNLGYPIPESPPIEGGNNSTGDRHVLMIDTGSCTLYELYHVFRQGNTWTAGSGAVFDLASNSLRPDSWTSADAAGLPIFPGLVRYDEVAAGSINHMIRFTAPKTGRAYLWPARHYASSNTDLSYPPMGLVMRLRSSFDTSLLKPQARVIARALMNYGMILADNGSAWYMSGVPDERWDMDDLFSLRKIHGKDFEAVDLSSLIVSSNSGQTSTSTDVAESQSSHQPVVSSASALRIICQTNGATCTDVSMYTLLGSLLDSDEINITADADGYTVDVSRLQSGLYLFRASSRAQIVLVP